MGEFVLGFFQSRPPSGGLRWPLFLVYFRLLFWFFLRPRSVFANEVGQLVGSPWEEFVFLRTPLVRISAWVLLCLLFTPPLCFANEFGYLLGLAWGNLICDFFRAAPPLSWRPTLAALSCISACVFFGIFLTPPVCFVNEFGHQLGLARGNLFCDCFQSRPPSGGLHWRFSSVFPLGFFF